MAAMAAPRHLWSTDTAGSRNRSRHRRRHAYRPPAALRTAPHSPRTSPRSPSRHKQHHRRDEHHNHRLHRRPPPPPTPAPLSARIARSTPHVKHANHGESRRSPVGVRTRLENPRWRGGERWREISPDRASCLGSAILYLRRLRCRPLRATDVARMRLFRQVAPAVTMHCG